ncbi:cation ABC transporter substrate-binding protein [Campylobacter sp. MIT 99-7217]|uniref:metal ABC transporter solute-binding protein, Zn/Mn family n=1 Tax=Campylobacter sp. MIT 99-7217 TaxID=535091 RepID=UPI00115A4B8D|nr:zinc ABC transporter substrate-binding protein [Campylobacter sp. MIT 99-7217]TQR33035.1 cation ABC transporter substrate-binding protein [Campylobacter sp. MIT 99-7217]
MRSIFLLFFSILSLFAKPIVSVSIPPQAFFVEKIAKDKLEINIIVPPNTDEHNVDFKPEIMAKLEKSDIYFTTGLEFEKIMLDKFKSLFKNLEIVDLTRGVKIIQERHSHEHSHHENEPHIWLDPILVKTQAQTIADALSAKYPQEKVFFEANLEEFQKELDSLNAEILELLKDKKGKKFIVYHPSWTYFALRYNLVQIPVEIEGKEPKIKDLKALIEKAKKEAVKTIFVQKGFPQNAAKTLAKEIGAKVLEIDHLSRNWDKELLKSAQILSEN